MAQYERIYSPDGEPFEVTPDRAAELILNQGWTRQPVETVAPAEPERAVTTVSRRTTRTRPKAAAEPPVEDTEEI